MISSLTAQMNKHHIYNITTWKKRIIHWSSTRRVSSCSKIIIKIALFFLLTDHKVRVVGKSSGRKEASSTQESVSTPLFLEKLDLTPPICPRYPKMDRETKSFWAFFREIRRSIWGCKYGENNFKIKKRILVNEKPWRALDLCLVINFPFRKRRKVKTEDLGWMVRFISWPDFILRPKKVKRENK